MIGCTRPGGRIWITTSCCCPARGGAPGGMRTPDHLIQSPVPADGASERRFVLSRAGFWPGDRRFPGESDARVPDESCAHAQNQKSLIPSVPFAESQRPVGSRGLGDCRPITYATEDPTIQDSLNRQVILRLDIEPGLLEVLDGARVDAGGMVHGDPICGCRERTGQRAPRWVPFRASA
jgi:hypothetical protein